MGVVQAEYENPTRRKGRKMGKARKKGGKRSSKRTPPRGKNGRFLTKRQIAAKKSARKRSSNRAPAKKRASTSNRAPKRTRAPRMPRRREPPRLGPIGSSTVPIPFKVSQPSGQLSLNFKKKRPKRGRASYGSRPNRPGPSGMYAGRPAPKYKVSGHHREGYHQKAFTVPAHDVPPRYIWDHWANPGMPDTLVNVAKGVGGAIAAALGIYLSGKVVQKLNLTKGKMTLALGALGVFGAGALAVVDPGLSGAIGVPLISAAILVHTGGIQPSSATARAGGAGTATRDLAVAMGEITKLGPEMFAGRDRMGDLATRGELIALTGGGGRRSHVGEPEAASAFGARFAHR